MFYLKQPIFIKRSNHFGATTFEIWQGNILETSVRLIFPFRVTMNQVGFMYTYDRPSSHNDFNAQHILIQKAKYTFFRDDDESGKKCCMYCIE